MILIAIQIQILSLTENEKTALRNNELQRAGLILNPRYHLSLPLPHESGLYGCGAERDTLDAVTGAPVAS